MAKTAPSALDHIFSSHDLFRRRCAIVWAWSILSAALLWMLLLVVGLFVGVLVDRGRLAIDIPPSQLARFRELTNLPAGDEPDSSENKTSTESATPDPANPVVPALHGDDTKLVHIRYDESGILPSVWRSRNYIWGGCLAWLFRNIEPLQSSILASMILLLTGILVFTAREGCLSKLRGAAQLVALDAVAPARRNVHRQALRLGPEDLDGSGLTIARELYIADIDTIRECLARRIEFDIRFPLELICLAAVAISIQPLMAAQFLLFLGIVWYYLEAQGNRAAAESKLATDRVTELLRNQADGFQSARLVRGLGIEQLDHDHFANHLVKFHELSSKRELALNHAQYLRFRDVAACAAVGGLLLFLLATHVRQDELSVAGGCVFVAVWLQAKSGVKALRSRHGIIQVGNVAAEKVQAYLARIPSVSQAVGARFLQPLAKILHFDSVTYRNPAGRAHLNEIDLTMESGRTYSIVSLDPLESQSLVSMLPRFIEPQKGRILFDGEDIAWSTLESLRAETVFVGADDSLLPGTILDNIRGGRADYTLQQAIEAAKLTHAHNFIVKLFDGYESDVPEHAERMDASQRFRLGLARAMIRNPALLIIEEPKINLDDDTKSLLADAYERICQNRTVIFLPGRLSTVRRCDQVIVLNEGRVAAIGPQTKLVNMSPIYRHWEYLNFNEFRHHE